MTREPEIPPAREAPSLLRGALLVGSLTLLSRITGLLRETLQAWLLGTGMAADAFRVAFLLPNLFRRLVGEGAITSAFVPVYAGYLDGRSSAEGRAFAEKFLSFWLLAVTLMTLGGVAFSGWLVSLAFGWGSFADPEKLELTVDLSRALFWYLLLVGGAAALQGILNARGVFGVPAFAPVAFNLAFVTAGAALHGWLGPGRAAHAMALAVLAAGAVQVLVLVPPVLKLGIRLVPRNPLDHPGVREVMRLLLPGTLGAGIYQLNAVVSTSLAARLQEGAVSSLSYSSRLMEFVLGVFVYALSTVSLTTLARHASAGDRASFDRTLGEVLRLTTFITIPSTVGLYVLRRPIISLLFANGQFDERSLELTQAAFQGHVAGILFVGWSRVLVACFHARKDLRTPVVQGAFNMVVHLALAWWLSERLGHSGIALAASAAALLQAAALFWVLYRRLPGLRAPGVARTAARTLAASALMGLLCHAGMSWAWTPGGRSKLEDALVVALLVAAGAGTFFAGAWALGLEEARTVTGRIAGRLGAGRCRNAQNVMK